MKWFKHLSDSYSNLKLQTVIARFGTEGYGLFWICVELVAQQGVKSRIEQSKMWKNKLRRETSIEEDRLEAILTLFGEVNLIDKKALNKGILYIPKLTEYSDEYTQRIGTNSRQSRENIGVDKNRRDKNREDKSIKGVSPAEISREFFDQGPIYDSLLKDFSEGRSPALIENEFKKFVLYWTEPNKSGSKVRWETQQTFEVKRRLVTWLTNAGNYNGGGTRRPSGQGLA